MEKIYSNEILLSSDLTLYIIYLWSDVYIELNCTVILFVAMCQYILVNGDELSNW